ncbi:MAG: carbon-nitrogen hydrolase family protein [Eggerthellaceae bacterium]|jgi:predicted amidohydrolase
MQVTIACVQIDCSLGDKESNIQKMISWMEKVTHDAAIDLIVFPELAVTGYECGELYPQLAETFPDGESIKRLAKAAAQFGVHLVFGFVEKAKKDGKDVCYNAAALIDDEGKPIGCYRKSHLVEGVDTDFLEKGTDYPVFDTKLGKIGIMICWDTAYPEVARILALHGAEIIIVPAAWEAPQDGDWDIVMSARSFDNVVYLASCNQVGTDKTLTYFGKSKIVGPLGRTIVQAKDRECAIQATVNTDELPDLRNGYYVLLRDRNPETYHSLIDPTLGR